MALNPNIILAGQAPDIMGAMDRGRVAAEGQINLNRQNALARLYQEQGAGIAAGNQGSINALAAFDPVAAQGVQQNILGMENTRLGMAQTRQQMTALDERTKREAVEYAKSIGAEKAAAEAAQLEAAVKQAMGAKDAASFDAMMVQNGRPELVGMFDERDSLAYQFMELADVMKQTAPPVPLSKAGKTATDIANGIIPTGTTDSPETVINMGEGDKFYETLDKTQAEMFNTLMTEGVQAGRTLGLVDRLDGLLKTTPTGGAAAFTQLAGEIGIDLGGLSDVQAVSALINQIVPQQRQPGSGPMSDADLALFKQSVPRLINQPGGNAKIIETMRGISNYVVQQAEIADAVANREITPAEGRKMLKALANPLESFSTNSASTPAPKGKAVEIDGFTIEAVE